MNRSLLLIIGSPFTAWVPLLVHGLQLIKKPLKIVLHPINVGVIGLFFWSIISAVYNKDLMSFAASFIFILYLVLISWVNKSLLSFEKIHRLLREIWVISLIPAVLGILEKIISTQFEMNWLVKVFWNPTYFPTIENYRIMSTFGNPNVAGDWFGIMSLLSFYFLEHSGYRKRKLIVFGNILFLSSLVLTGSKGAMAAYFCSALVFAVLKHSKRTWLFLSFFLGLSTIGISSFFNLFETYNSRDLIWQNCIELIKNSPIFGCGILGIYPRIQEVHGHNLFLSIGASLGVVGLILVVYQMMYLINTLWLLNHNRIRMAPILTGLLTFLLVHSIVDFTILTPQIGIFYFGTCAVVTRFGAVFLDQKYPKFSQEAYQFLGPLFLKPKRSLL